MDVVHATCQRDRAAGDVGSPVLERRGAAHRGALHGAVRRRGDALPRGRPAGGCRPLVRPPPAAAGRHRLTRAPPSTLYPLPSTLCPLPSALCPLPSALYPMG